MRQFYETYRGDEIVTALLSQLPWTQNLIILNQSKRPEEREFYLRMAIRERWGKRDLERQFRQALFERAVLHPPKVSPVVRQIHGAAVGSTLRDEYFFEFLDLPTGHTEYDLHRGLLARLKDFWSSSGTISVLSDRNTLFRLAAGTSRSTSCFFIEGSIV